MLNRVHGLHYSRYIPEDQKEVKEVKLKTDSKEKSLESRWSTVAKQNWNTTGNYSIHPLCGNVLKCMCIWLLCVFVGVCVFARLPECVHFLQCDVVKQWEEGRMWCRMFMYNILYDVGDPHCCLSLIQSGKTLQYFLCYCVKWSFVSRCPRKQHSICSSQVPMSNIQDRTRESQREKN